VAEERTPSTVSVERTPRAAFWSIIRRTLLWGPVCGAAIAVAGSIASDPLAVVLFPAYVIGGGVVGLLASVLGILVALGAWALLRVGGVGVRRRAIASAAASALAVPAVWTAVLLVSINPDGAALSIWTLAAAVTVASVALATLLCRRFLRMASATA
jgi:hypothetical protein